jgi:DNA polymerase III delta prime subunit
VQIIKYTYYLIYALIMSVFAWHQISDVLHSVAAKEGIKVPPSLATLICQQSGRDLRKAILSLEVAKAQK